MEKRVSENPDRITWQLLLPYPTNPAYRFLCLDIAVAIAPRQTGQEKRPVAGTRKPLPATAGYAALNCPASGE